jgi:hypothetical protein
MQQPNYLQVTNGLRAALSLAEVPSNADAIGVFRDKIASVLGEFEHANATTDRAYLEWRRCVGNELQHFRKIRLELVDLAARCDEHGLDGVPRRQIVYTEREHVFAIARLVADFLLASGSQWAWTAPARESLNAMCDAARDAQRESDTTLGRYRVAVSARVKAYGAAVALLRELVRDASSARYGATFDTVRECAGA